MVGPVTSSKRFLFAHKLAALTVGPVDRLADSLLHYNKTRKSTKINLNKYYFYILLTEISQTEPI